MKQCAVLLLLLLAFPTPARAQWVIAAYFGAATTGNSALTFSQPASNTTTRFDSIAYEGQSFHSPPYYGYRVAYFPRSPGWFGVEAELVHLKVFTQLPAGALLERFSISHGQNMLVANAVVRHAFGEGGDYRAARLLALARVGAGPTIPHVESTVAGVADERYHMALRILRRSFLGVARSGTGSPREFWEMFYPLGWRDALTAAAGRAAVDPFLVAAVVREESSFYPGARSRVGARGLMQLMPDTGRAVAQARQIPFPDPDVLDQPVTNLELGSTFFAGTRTSWKASSEVYEARSENFPWISFAVKPGVPFSTMKPRTTPSTLAHTSATSATEPFVIQALAPFRT